jgi:hypothetical protein
MLVRIWDQTLLIVSEYYNFTASDLQVVGLVLEALDQGKEASSGTESGDRVRVRVSDQSDLVLHTQVLASLAELGKALRRVVGPVETGKVLVELVEVVLDFADGLLLLCQSSGLVSRRGGSGTTGVKSQRNPPSGRVLLRLDITSKQETLLAEANLAGLLGNGHHGETDLADPEVHEAVDVLTRGFAQCRPQVVGGGVGVLVSLEVVGNTLEEDLLAKVSAQHADDRATLEVTDVVEDLVDLETIVDRNLNGVRCAQSVEREGLLNGISLEHVSNCKERSTSGSCTYNKLSPNVPVYMKC